MHHRPHILLCLRRPEAAVGLSAMLAHAGFETVPTATATEALVALRRDLPHFVIADADLPDGELARLAQAMHETPVHRLVPLLVRGQLPSGAKAAMARLLPRFCGDAPGRDATPDLVRRLREELQGMPFGSPYGITVDGAALPAEMVLTWDAEVVGRVDDQLAVMTSAEIDRATSLVLVPKTPGLAPAMVSGGVCKPRRDGVLALFPLGKIRGKGLTWIRELPEGDSASEGDRPVVLFCEADVERFRQLKPILEGYGLSLEHVISPAAAASRLKADPTRFACAYLHQLTNDAAGIAWRKALESLPEALRPPQIIATSAVGARSTQQCLYLTRPFGLGALVEAMQALSSRVQSVATAPRQRHDVLLQLPCKLAGLTELGGKLRTASAISPARRVRLVHPVLTPAWGDSVAFSIGGIKPAPGLAKTFEAEFQIAELGLARGPYFAKILDLLPPELTSGAPTPPPARPASGGEAARGKLLTALIQAISLVLDYYLGASAKMQKPLRAGDAKSDGCLAPGRVKGEAACDLALDFGRDLLTLLLPRVCGYGGRGGLTDEGAREAATTLADQIFFAAEQLASRALPGIRIEAVEAGSSAPRPRGGFRIPFVVDRFTLHLEIGAAAAAKEAA